MSYPILEKEAEHLQIIADTKKEPALVTLAALLATELELFNNWGKFADNKGPERRIAWWIMCLHHATCHDGDCVKVACSCVLCHSLSAIEEAREAINAANGLDIYKLINVILATQPKVGPLLLDDIENRVNYDGEIQDHAQRLVEYTKGILSLELSTLEEWWETNNDTLILSSKIA
jgi:hypothetical protein